MAGFYLVLSKPMRVKSLYCGFNQTSSIENFINNQRAITKISSSQITIQFCNGSGISPQPCNFLYPDYPDIIPPVAAFNQMFKKNNKTSAENNYLTGPSNCDDLQLIGHKLQGFYMILRNALKVKIIYCDFSTENENDETRTKQRHYQGENVNNSSRVCKGIGSQPCSCYYSKIFPETLQLELSDDEITRKAMHENGTGPSTCDELQQIGHNLNGFYFLRLNSKTIKTSYCKLNGTNKVKPKENMENKELLMSTSMKPTSTLLDGI